MATFGELTIKASEFELNEGVGNGSPTAAEFSNIDLNGTQSSLTKASSTYTSFEESMKQSAASESSYNGFSSNLRSLTAPYSTSIGGVANDNNNNLQAKVSARQSSSFSATAGSPPTNGGGGGGATILVTSSNGSSPSSMLSTVTENSTRLALKTASTIESLRQWSKSAYKCTRQIVSEKLGKTTRTTDPELEAIIENLRETKRKYETVLNLALTLSQQFGQVFDTQRQMAELFTELSQKSPELIEDFSANAETQRQLFKHGEALIKNLNSFVSNLNTLCNKTIDDTLLTIRNYEAARLEYDANRNDLEALQALPQRNEKIALQISDKEHDLAAFKEKYDKLKKDVEIKVKFLDENRIKVMRKQLFFFHQSIAAYYTGNKQDLDEIAKQYSSHGCRSPNMSTSQHVDNESPSKIMSFLEH